MDILDDTTSASNNSPPAKSQQKDKDGSESNANDQEVDSAISLMIVSCVTRLLQIFESLVYIVRY